MGVVSALSKYFEIFCKHRGQVTKFSFCLNDVEIVDRLYNHSYMRTLYIYILLLVTNRSCIFTLCALTKQYCLFIAIKIMAFIELTSSFFLHVTTHFVIFQNLLSIYPYCWQWLGGGGGDFWTNPVLSTLLLLKNPFF